MIYTLGVCMICFQKEKKYIYDASEIVHRGNTTKWSLQLWLTLPLCKVSWPDKTELSVWYLACLPEKKSVQAICSLTRSWFRVPGNIPTHNGHSTQRRNWPSGRISDNTPFSESQNVIEVSIKYLTRKINKVLSSNWARNQNRYHKTYFFPLRGAQLVHHCSWG